MARLIDAPGVDQVLWRSDGRVPGRTSYVAASRAGSLEFGRAPDGLPGVRDSFGTSWQWSGECEVLDLGVHDGRIQFGQYPNAFERIAGALDSEHSGDLWITARPGCDFEAPGGKAHVGGSSHGSLHTLDSLSPVIVAGAPSGFVLPEELRPIDLAPLCMQFLGLPMRYAIRDPRPTPTHGMSFAGNAGRHARLPSAPR